MLNVIMLSVIMLNVAYNLFMLSVVAPIYKTPGAIFTTLHFLRNLRMDVVR